MNFSLFSIFSFITCTTFVVCVNASSYGYYSGESWEYKATPEEYDYYEPITNTKAPLQKKEHSMSFKLKFQSSGENINKNLVKIKRFLQSRTATTTKTNGMTTETMPPIPTVLPTIEPGQVVMGSYRRRGGNKWPESSAVEAMELQDALHKTVYSDDDGTITTFLEKAIQAIIKLRSQRKAKQEEEEEQIANQVVIDDTADSKQKPDQTVSEENRSHQFRNRQNRRKQRKFRRQFEFRSWKN